MKLTIRLLDFIPFLLLLLVVSCSSGETLVGDRVTLENYEYIGEAHNQFVKYFLEQTDSSAMLSPNSLNKEKVCDMLVECAESFESEKLPKEKLIRGFKGCDSIYVGVPLEDVTTRVSNPIEKSVFPFDLTSREELDAFLDFSVKSRVIDNHTYRFLSQLTNIVGCSFEGSVDRDLLRENLDAINSEVRSLNNFESSSTWNVIGPVLAVADASFELWDSVFVDRVAELDSCLTEEEADSIRNVTVPAFVASDLGGAILGAAVSAYNQYSANGTVSDWGNVGIDALTSGVLSSVGVENIVGRTVIHALNRGFSYMADIFWKIIFKIW